ncbi:MBL fold metallo-hydrolase [uncultured Microbacterium sp.]|uniref:MBL fold metallo-hydrolase n=1 Tax=uncultured Microbacterium sp. TaxID=191216 RepID=UPI0025DEDA6B|nr:MBL fold metallo-hydrolase [uncultured Microbacterium sp.]
MSELTFFACGETTHDMSLLLRGAPRERRVFPAGVFLYDSGARRVLFDTGYAPEPWRAGLGGWAYRRMLPPRVGAGDTIAEQLDPATITHVVLSHLHPDHVGGVRFFPNAAFVLSDEARRTLERPRLRDGLLRDLLPPWFREARVLPSPAFRSGPRGLRTADLFGDGSYLLVDLPGHTRGHLGALIEHEVLLAGDAAWGRDLLGEERRIRLLPRLVSHDMTRQRETARMLLAAEQDGLRLLFSHDHHPTGQNLL